MSVCPYRGRYDLFLVMAIIMKSLLIAVLPPFLVAAGDAITGFDWGTISATGLLGWYLWYTTKIVFPSHQKQVSEMQDSFNDQFVSQRDHYEKILTEIQDRQDKRHAIDVQKMDKMVETLEKMSENLETVSNP